jgi:hypothetical protein
MPYPHMPCPTPTTACRFASGRHGASSKMVGARHAVPRRAVPQPSPRHAGSRRGDAVRRPSGRVAHRVGATRCVIHRVGLPIASGRRGALPIGSGCPSGRGDPTGRPYMTRPTRRTPTITTARRFASGRRGALPKMVGARHAVPRCAVPHRSYPNHHHGVPVRVGATRCVPIGSGCPSRRGDAVRCPSGRGVHRVGATRCVAHRVGATRCVAQNGWGTACRAPTCRTATITTACRFASGRRGASPIGSGCPSGWGDAVRRPKWLGHGMPCPDVPYPIGRTPTITTACRFASGRRDLQTRSNSFSIGVK